MVDRPLSESSLAELAVLIVDCQTTGATPTQGSVLELGWCVVCAANERRDVAPQAHWVTLPAGERISAQVRQLTGFHEGVLETAITPEDAWQRLRAVSPAATTEPSATRPVALSRARAWRSCCGWCSRERCGWCSRERSLAGRGMTSSAKKERQ